MLRDEQTAAVFTAALLSMQKGRVQTKQITVNNAKNAEFIKDAILQEDGLLHLENLRTSPDYMKSMRRDFLAFLRGSGTPTFFFTASCADTKWVELLQTLFYQEHGRHATEDELESLSFKQRCELVSSDPVLVAKYYYNRMEGLFDHIIDNTDVLGDVTDRAHVEEAQKRGTPHRHSLLWVKDSPKFDKDDPSKDGACEEFIDEYITTDLRALPEHLRTLHSHVCAKGKCLNKNGKCRFNAPWYPMRRSRILRHLLLIGEEAVVAAQDLKRIDGVLTRLDAALRARAKGPLSEGDEGLANVTFDQFLASCAVTEADYERAIASALKRPAVVFYKREPQHIRVNTFNAKITSIWEAHTDLQFILDEHACVQYLTSYMLKGDRRISQALHDIISKAGKDQDVAAAIRSAGLKFLHMSEVSSQMVAFLLLQYPLRFLSRAVFFIDSRRPAERSIILKRKSMLQDMSADSMDVFMPNLHDHFREYVQNRQLFHGPDLCLADYALRYSRPSKKRKTPNEGQEAQSAEGAEGQDAQGAEDAEEAVHMDSLQTEEPRGGGDDNMATDTEAEAYPPTLQQRAGVHKHLRSRPCIPRFSVLPGPTSIEEECRSLIMLFAPGSAWAGQREAAEDAALLGGCPSYTVRYEQLRQHIEPLAEQYNYKAEIDWEKLMNAQEAEMQDDACSIYSENSMDQALMAPTVIPDLPEALTLQDETPPTHFSTTATAHVLWDNEAYLKQGSILTGQQRRVCQYAVQHVLLHEWGFEKDPLMLVVTGGAGTGKSCTLRFSREALERVLPRNTHGDGVGILLQVAAQNGKAAWLASGQTLHSAMGWTPNNEGNLSNARKQELIAKFKDLKVFMLDEASQVPNKNLAYLHNDLQEYGNNFHAPFGDVNMACFADFMQLEPIIRGHQFFAPCPLPPKGLDPNVQLWELFRVAELTQVMRHDGWMLPTLNRMRIGAHTAEDNARWKGLERVAPPHLPLHCCTNDRVVQHNVICKDPKVLN
jgi:hypothetical protein